MGDQVFFQGHAAPGHLRARLPGGSAHRVAARPLPPGGRARRGPQLVPAPAADARLLGVPHGLDGPRPAGRASTRPASTATCTTAASRTPAPAASGRSSATARPTSRRPLGSLSIAAREGLDNLTFVVNCNLQRLDGPVRGNGKIIQELEAVFRGAGWNVIKVIWGREWDELLARDIDGVLVHRMGEVLDGESQKFSVESGRLHPRALLRRRPAAAGAGRGQERRRGQGAAPRRPRLPQALRRVPGRGRAQGRADGDPRPDRQGLDARPGRRGAQHHAPGQEAQRGRAQDLPRPAPAADPRREAQGRALLPPGPDAPEIQYLMERRRALGGPLPRRVSSSKTLGAARRPGLRRVHGRLRDAGSLDHDGLRQAAAEPAPRSRASASAWCRSSPTRRAPSAWTRSSRRSASTPPLGPALRPGRLEPGALLPRGDRRPGARGGHHRGRLVGLVPGRRHVVRDPRRADDPLLHLLFDVRLPAHRRRVLGLRRRPRAAASCWAPRPAARRSTARGSSTRTGTACWSRRSSRRRASTTRRSPTRPRSSSARASTGCCARARTTSTT